MNEELKPGSEPDGDRSAGGNFIQEIIENDLKSGKVKKVVTRFPPEPNGYLHIGHAKAISIDYGMAVKYDGEFHLRYDDTNPSKEEQEYIDSIQTDLKWLGADWGSHLYFASDYFSRMFEWAIQMIQAGKAYVCDLNADQVREYRGTLTQPGRESPGRSRSIAENMDLFMRMQQGEFPDGSRTLRAKIDMAAPNINLRDPVMYRIQKVPHHRQGSKWNVYPMYDWAHGLEDSIEGVTHSLCSLEFEDHRPLYNWFLDQLPVPCHPQQIEFARMNLTYTLMSKRKLLELVEQKIVEGWDDPRMPTLSGLRRRGFTPESIRDFCERIGVAKRDSMVDVALLEHCLREDLNKRAPRFMAVLRPLKVVIDNYPEDQIEELECVNNPEDPSAGTRKVPFSKVIYIERDDFKEDPPKKYFRLTAGREVRLRWAYFVKCESFVKDPVSGEVTEVHCTYDPATRGGNAPDGRNVKATIHWVSARHAVDAEVRLYDRLFTLENLNEIPEGKDAKDFLNPGSLEIIRNGKLEPALGSATAGYRCQFERQGYFCADTRLSKPGAPVFNRAVSLKDTWLKIEKRGSQALPEKNASPLTPVN